MEFDPRDPRLAQKLEHGSGFVTHSKEEAFAFADRLALLEKGRVVQIGTPKCNSIINRRAPLSPSFWVEVIWFVCDWLAAGHLASALGEIRVECDPAACPEPLLFLCGRNY